MNAIGAFEYRNRELTCEGVRLSDIARKVGTPVYVYSRARIEANFRRVAAAFEPLHARIHYAVKANGNLAVLRLLRKLGAGFDVVSGGELFRALQAGADPACIVFAGAGKTDAELAYALDQHVGCINVESTDELRVLNDLAGTRGATQPVALRINPGVDPHAGHRLISTGHAGSKFGIEMDEARRIGTGSLVFPHLDICGLHIHIGSQLQDPDPLVEALQRILALAHSLKGIRALDIGGGIPVAYHEGETAAAPEEFARAVQTALGEESARFQISLEPGRFLVADAGALIAQVQTTKYSYGRRIVTTDAGMTDLIRPALYEAYHPIWPLIEDKPTSELADVAGPVCESSDFLGRERPLPAVKRGDLLAVLFVGAYGATMSLNYNARTRAPEVLVEGDAFRVVRRRETWEDLVRAEKADQV